MILDNINRLLIQYLDSNVAQHYCVPNMEFGNLRMLIYEVTASDAPKIAIVGRAMMTESALDLIFNSEEQQTFVPNINEDRLRSGFLGTYRGAKIITISNPKDDQGFIVAGNVMYVVGYDSVVAADESGVVSSFQPYIIRYIDNSVTP